MGPGERGGSRQAAFLENWENSLNVGLTLSAEDFVFALRVSGPRQGNYDIPRDIIPHFERYRVKEKVYKELCNPKEIHYGEARVELY